MVPSLMQLGICFPHVAPLLLTNLTPKEWRCDWYKRRSLRSSGTAFTFFLGGMLLRMQQALKSLKERVRGTCHCPGNGCGD